MKILRRIIILAIAFSVVTGFASCKKEESNPDIKGVAESATQKINFTETINVFNASEYIDETTIADFEREFAIKVEYTEFESNEEMYHEIVSNPGSYDVLIPSDYTIDRLIKEDRLAKIDQSKVPNIVNIAEEYLNPSYDPANDYVVPYMVGTLGILYNKKYAADSIDSWNALFDTRYSGKVLMLDSQRDAIGAVLKLLGFSMNSNDDTELEQAKEMLLAARSTVAAYNESEEIRDKLVAGEGVLGVVYSGDAKIAIDRNPDLAYVIPKEGANKWVDGFVIMKDTKHLDAAQKFIDFMCRSNIAVRNMSEIGYTSPVKGAWSEFNANEIMFPALDELNRCEAFLYNAEAAQKYSGIWTEILR